MEQAVPAKVQSTFRVIVSPQSNVSFFAESVGYHPEWVSIQGNRCRASVIYAPHLGRASAIAERIDHETSDLLLLDLHVDLAETVDLLAERLVIVQQAEPSHLPNRLCYFGTYGGLGSYLADVARLGFVDGVIVSPIFGTAAAAVELNVDRALCRLADELGHQWHITVDHPTR